MMADGDVARDVAWNFIERWNHGIRNGCGPQLKTPIYLLPSDPKNALQLYKPPSTSGTLREQVHHMKLSSLLSKTPFSFLSPSIGDAPPARAAPMSPPTKSSLDEYLDSLSLQGLLTEDCTCQVVRYVLDKDNVLFFQHHTTSC